MQPPPAPRGRFGTLLIAALRRYGALPPGYAPITPAACVDVPSLPAMRTYPLVAQRRCDMIL